MQKLANVLSDGDTSAAQREEAARRLLQQPSEASLRAIRAALEDVASPRTQLAAARALAGEVNPDASLAASLKLLIGPDRQLTEAAIQALSSFKDNAEALRQLVQLAGSRQQREAVRLTAVAALGNMVEKPAAEFLVSLLTREEETQPVHTAAANALVAMTGHTEYGRDPQQWLRWWSENAQRPDAQWRAEILANQASRYSQLRVRYDELVREAESFLSEQYTTAAPAQQQELLLRYLRSSNAQVRSVGAKIVRDEAMAARRIPQQARDYLVQMIADTDRGVRLSAAAALHAINDPQALTPLLEQIVREQDPEVRAALAAPLGSIGDLRAVPVLRKLLHDPYTTTASAAAAALRELGPTLREKSPADATEIAQELRTLLEETPPGPGTLALRESLVEAMVPLRSRPLMSTFYRLLRETSSVRIRWAALRALGELGDPQSADTIVRYLEDRENGVRLEAIRALGKTSPADHAEALYRRLSPANESDSNVRDEAWKVLEPAFAKLSLEQLPDWVRRFADEPARRLAVLRALIDGYTRSKNAELLAATQQKAGAAEIELNQPADAAAFFKPAFEYWQKRDPEHMVTEQLAEQYLLALLRGRQYADAARFSGELVKGRASYQQTVGVTIRGELDRLQKLSRLADCLALLEQMRKMTPPLAPHYAEDFAQLEVELRRASTQESPTAPAVP